MRIQRAMEEIRGAAERSLCFLLRLFNFEHLAQISTITMLFIKQIKVENLTCSKFKYYKIILILCNKIGINESEHFTQTIETKTNKSEHFRQTNIGIHIFALHSDSYIHKKSLR